jgi:hypothetical protein
MRRSFRLGALKQGEWRSHSHAPTFELGSRLVAVVPESDPRLFADLLACMQPPLFLLYVLHSPRGEAAPGRYQSPPLQIDEAQAFLQRFADFLGGDGRFDLWAHSPGEQATLVWDRHDLLFGYGPLERFASELRARGFSEGEPRVPTPHEHHYRAELDPSARELIAAFDWSYSPLRPEDEQ